MMNNLDPTQVLGAVAIIISGVIITLQNRKQGKEAAEAKTHAAEAKVVVEEVRTTLTENNGGSSVKDQLDRMERRQVLADERSVISDQRLAALTDEVRRYFLHNEDRHEKLVIEIQEIKELSSDTDETTD